MTPSVACLENPLDHPILMFANVQSGIPESLDSIPCHGRSTQNLVRFFAVIRLIAVFPNLFLGTKISIDPFSPHSGIGAGRKRIPFLVVAFAHIRSCLAGFVSEGGRSIDAHVASRIGTKAVADIHFDFQLGQDNVFPKDLGVVAYDLEGQRRRVVAGTGEGGKDFENIKEQVSRQVAQVHVGRIGTISMGIHVVQGENLMGGYISILGQTRTCVLQSHIRVAPIEGSCKSNPEVKERTHRD